MKDKILEHLRHIQDPELGRDIVALGMVKEIAEEGGKVYIELQMRAPEAVQTLVREEVRKTVSSIAGIQDVTVSLASPQRKTTPFQPKAPIPGIQKVIAIASGKGGVGKTTVTVNLAVALAKLGFSVGLMDGDIYGPNVPMMLGIPTDQKPDISGDDKMVPIESQGVRMISMGVLVPADQPMIWRGPMLHNAVTQFVQKVDWGELDFLLVDLPPGTGDVQLSLVQTVPLTGAVMVTTPQEVALSDVRKGIALFQKTSVPILGVIENMSGPVFGSGGGEKTARQYQVPFLGTIPLNAEIRTGGDQGKPIVLSHSDSEAAQAFFHAAKQLVSF